MPTVAMPTEAAAAAAAAAATAATTTMTDDRQPTTTLENDNNSSMSYPTYELGIADADSQVVWIDGPFKAGESDLNIFRKGGGLKSKMPDGKKAIADGGYTGGHPSI